MNISLTGNLGSGKSTICKIICDEYGYERYSTGNILRKLAEDRGITVLEMNEIAKSDSKYDHMIDDMTTEVSRERKDQKVFFDSRLAWHFAEDTFKVFLSVSLDEAARRVFADSTRGDVESYSSVEDAKQRLGERADVEEARYKDFYQIDYFNFNNFNLVLDSTDAKPEDLAKILMKEHDSYVAAGAKEGKEFILCVKRFGLEIADTDITPDMIYESDSIVVKRSSHDVVVSEGLEELKKAAALGYRLVSVRYLP